MQRRPRADPRTAARPDGPMPVAPHPELRRRMKERLDSIRSSANGDLGAFFNQLRIRDPVRHGLNDGVRIPATAFAPGTSVRAMRRMATERLPLRGTIRLAVVLVDFDDRQLTRRPSELDDVLFSIGRLEHGSVREYYREASNGLVDIEGALVGPYRLPRTLAEYAHGASGLGDDAPNARTMARDAAIAAEGDLDLRAFDNDGDGIVDGLLIVHAGAEAAETGRHGDLWAHKWTLAGDAVPVGGATAYAYASVAENCRVGVCCHELGHLLFSWPDLHPPDGGSEGLGDWCVMASGSWNGEGEVPAHPSAWCKATQGWVTVLDLAADGVAEIPEVKDTATVARLRSDGETGTEYFLAENRLRSGFDEALPGEGLLVYHVDESMEDNAGELNGLVGLLQADGRNDLESGAGRGDDGDPYPGSSDNRVLDETSNPSTRSFAGVPTGVSIRGISEPGPKAVVRVAVSSGAMVHLELTDTAELVIDGIVGSHTWEALLEEI